MLIFSFGDKFSLKLNSYFFYSYFLFLEFYWVRENILYLTNQNQIPTNMFSIERLSEIWLFVVAWRWTFHTRMQQKQQQRIGIYFENNIFLTKFCSDFKSVVIYELSPIRTKDND